MNNPLYSKAPLQDINFIPVIMEEVSSRFMIESDKIMERTRKREIVIARQAAHYAAKNMVKASLSAIGKLIGNKDHATVLHSARTIENLMDVYPDFRGKINSFIAKLNTIAINSSNDFVCSQCGSKDITTVVEIDPNFPKVINEMNIKHKFNNWCYVCNDNVEFIIAYQYSGKVNVLDNEIIS